MSKESTQINIDTIDQYDSILNLLGLLRALQIKSAKPTAMNLEYELRGEFYCIDCDVPRDDCFGHPEYDDYPDYTVDDDDDEPASADDKPSVDEKV